MKLPRIPTKKVLRVLGVIGVLVSVYLFVAGGILLLVKNTNKDNKHKGETKMNCT